MGSSRLLEFLVALIVGGLAVLGALFLIGFLLVEPIRSPPSEEPTRPLGKFPPPLPSLLPTLPSLLPTLHQISSFLINNLPDSPFSPLNQIPSF